ncbi:hypothetical protein BGX38DRAFT_1138708 [Terfezia claveryi]|nr:hypothetical protein BGX38DRAFT_1138708 [Terfezia claveryi]
MASPPKGVVFGPIKDWGRGSCKLLLEFGDKEEVKGRRQYVLEEVANWAGVPEFGDRGARALDLAMANTERAIEAWEGEGDWSRHISQIERDLREEEEVIKVTDGQSADRAVEILSRAVAIQDGAVNGQLDGYEVDYQTADKEDGMLESITVRPAKVAGGAMFRVAHHWTLMTPKSKRNDTRGEPARWVARLEEVDEGEESDYEAMRKKGKKHKLGDAKPLEALGRELGVDSLEPAIPRGVEDVHLGTGRRRWRRCQAPPTLGGRAGPLWETAFMRPNRASWRRLRSYRRRRSRS